MRKIIFVALFVVVAVAVHDAKGQGSAGNAGPPPISGEPYPLESTTKTITDFGTALMRAFGKPSAPASASVGKLVIDLSTLSGFELSLATMIEQLDQAPGDSNTKIFVLNQLLYKIKDQYQVIQNDFAALDKEWIAKNASLGIDIGNFAHDGALYYCIVSCRGQFYTGGAAIRLTAGGEFKLAEQLRKDVTSIQRLAADLQAAIRK